MKRQSRTQRRASMLGPAQPSIPELLTAKQVCSALHISRATLYRRAYRWTTEPGGRKRLYFAADIRLVLGFNTVAPSDAKGGR